VAPVVTTGFITDFLQALDCPRALAVDILFRNGEYAQIAKLECDPLAYNAVPEFRAAYAATNLLSKYKGLTLNIGLDEAAWIKFSEFEDLCGQTNTRFKDLGCDPLFKGHVVWLHNAVRRKIAQVLGEFDAEEMISDANWGPGASTLIKRRDASSFNKFQCETGITRDLFDLLPRETWPVNYPTWAAHLRTGGGSLNNSFPKFEVGNKVITVPKDAKANRVIAIEPGLNLWFQLAIGEMVRKRLLRFGINLRKQEINQDAAFRGSNDSQTATLDFSSASDSISRGTVEALLPWRWFSVMDSARSRFGMQGGTLLEWKKFSSMGNGFTFPLESLIFYAVACCCAEYLHEPQINASGPLVSVYGDDVIIPIRCLALFSEMSAFYGFTLNVKKSHFASNFRESCGAHFMEGVDCKPIYLKDRLSDVPSVFRLANAVRLLANRFCGSIACDAKFRAVFESLLSVVPKPCRLRIPLGYGDGGFIGNFDESTPVRERHGIEGYRITHVVGAPKQRKETGVGLLLARLWAMPTQDRGYLHGPRGHKWSPRDIEPSLRWSRDHPDDVISMGNFVPISSRIELRISTKGHLRQWPDLGPWL
jgi:hypothetical protein